MKNTSKLLFTLGLSVMIWGACQKETGAPSGATGSTKTLKLPLPDYKYNVGVISGSLAKLQVNSKQANLGRVLFYDPALSVSNTVACASCHNQGNAFSGFDAFNTGFTGEATDRNSMPLFNLGENGQFFWDMRKEGLEAMVLDPAVHLVEMGMESREKIAEKVGQIDYYQTLFEDVFGTRTPSVQQIEKSLSEFLLSLVSGSSKFDKVMNGQVQFTAQEQSGFNLFNQKQCNSCHGGINFNNLRMMGTRVSMIRSGGGWGGPTNPININATADFANIGLEYDYTDAGIKAEIQEQVGLPDIEQGLFKVPSLRNVALTGPYMHDGRFATLMDVINHYNHGVKKHRNLDARLINLEADPNTGEVTSDGQPRRLHLTEKEKEDIIAFLNTLTDYQFISDPKFANPFQ